MSQNDYVIANQTTPLFRADLNTALQALASNSSGATAPATTYANMLWYDTATNILKMRSEADDAWIALGTLDQSANTFAPAGVAELTQVQAEDDTSTVFGQVSGQRLSQAVGANGLGGSGQTSQQLSASRSFNTTYQNTTGSPIFVCVNASIGFGDGSSNIILQISDDNVTFVDASRTLIDSDVGRDGVSYIVTDDQYYRISSSDVDASISTWMELR